MTTKLAVITIVLFVLLAAKASAQCYTVWDTPSNTGNSTYPNQVKVSSTVTLGFHTVNCLSWDHVGICYGCAESGASYSYNGHQYVTPTDAECSTNGIYPPPPYTPWVNPNGYRCNSNVGKSTSFLFDTTQLPGTDSLPVPYHVNVLLEDASNNVLGSTMIPGDPTDRDVILYAANVPPSLIFLIGTGNYVIDGGFHSHSSDSDIAASYINNQPNSWQQYVFTPSGSGYTVCNINAVSGCLSDGGADGLLHWAQAQDVWKVSPAGSNWTVQDSATGKYIGLIPQALGHYIPMSATPVPLTLTQLGTSTIPTPTPAVTPTPVATPPPTPTPVATATPVAVPCTMTCTGTAPAGSCTSNCQIFAPAFIVH